MDDFHQIMPYFAKKLQVFDQKLHFLVSVMKSNVFYVAFIMPSSYNPCVAKKLGEEWI